MTDHKFTDEEVIKALECCSSGKIDGCNDCPLFYVLGLNVSTEECMESAISNAIDLINRQKEELDDLREIVFTDRSEAIKKLKAEAIKEFAERLKERAYTSSDWSHGEHPQVVECDDIDEIVEEMTEDN